MQEPLIAARLHPQLRLRGMEFGPRKPCREETKHRLAVALENGVARDQPLLRAHHYMLHISRRKLREAVYTERREELAGVRPFEIDLPS